MNKETLEALKESIAHWERLATGQRRDDEAIGTSSCPLCQRFYNVCEEACIRPDGEMCPVADHTGEICCDETPYRAAYRAAYVYNFNNPSNFDFDTSKFKVAAQVELDFLRSLLPEGETDQ